MQINASFKDVDVAPVAAALVEDAFGSSIACIKVVFEKRLGCQPPAQRQGAVGGFECLEIAGNLQR